MTAQEILGRFVKLRPWYVVCIGVIVSIGFTEIIVFIMSIHFRGRITYDYVITGTLTAFIVSLLVLSVIIHFVSKLRESEERYRSLVETSPDAILLADSRTEIVMVNQQGILLFGYEAMEEMIGRLLPDFAAIEERDRLVENLRKALESGSIRNIEHAMLKKDGTTFPAELNASLIMDKNGKTKAIIGVARDISERKMYVEKLRIAALYDSLTGLPNRALFLEQLRASIARVYRDPRYMFVVLLFDLDRFKKINDSLGHMTGDELLIEVARRLQKEVRPYDTVARLGGDEFIILLENVRNIRNAVRVAERLHSKIKVPISVFNYEVYITASIGITTSRTGFEKPEDILREADTAMHNAKESGRACYMIFNETMYAQARACLQLENSLRQAVEKNEFFLNYQPIVLSDTNEIAGFEALLRWNSQERGLVSPGEFIGVAEDTGLIIPIGKWVLREACAQMRAWYEQFPACSQFTISVNISARQFTPDIVETIKKILGETGLDPGSLRLEITENVVMGNTEIAESVFSELNDLNVKVQMDDFGTGYSSLGYLHRFPFHALKIDRSFIQAMCKSERAMEIVRTIVLMAGNTKMEVIAEGVETVEQLAEVRKLKCDYYQGYLFSKPLDKEGTETLLRTIQKTQPPDILSL